MALQTHVIYEIPLRNYICGGERGVFFEEAAIENQDAGLNCEIGCEKVELTALPSLCSPCYGPLLPGFALTGPMHCRCKWNSL